MSNIEELFHSLDKAQSAFQAEASVILADHSREIDVLRGDTKRLDILIRDKFEGIWLKILGLTTGLIGLAILIAQFFL